MLTASWRLVFPCNEMPDIITHVNANLSLVHTFTHTHAHTYTHAHTHIHTHTNSVSFTRKRWNCSKTGDLRIKRLVRGICQANLSGYLQTVVTTTSRKRRG